MSLYSRYSKHLCAYVLYVLYLPTYCVATLSPKAMFTALHFNLSLPLLIVQENGQNLKPACGRRFCLFYATIILKYHQEHQQNGNSHPHELQHGCQAGKCNHMQRLVERAAIRLVIVLTGYTATNCVIKEHCSKFNPNFLRN